MKDAIDISDIIENNFKKIKKFFIKEPIEETLEYNCKEGIHEWVKIGGANRIGESKHFRQLFICKRCNIAYSELE